MTLPNPGTPPETTAPEAHETPESGGTPQAPSGGKTVSEWEQSYKGLQAAYNKLKTASDQQIADLKAKLEGVTASFEELTQSGASKDTQLTVLQQKIAELTEETKKLSSEKGNVEAKVARTSMILKDFPELAGWEAQGLLPTGATEEEMRTALDAFRKQLSGQVGSGVQTMMAGATPPGGGAVNVTPSGSEESEEFLWAKLMETAGSKPQEYELYYNKYQALLDKKKK